MEVEKKVLLFGTFDVLHAGHEFIIEHALQKGKVFITLALDETIVKIKGAAPLHSYIVREKNLLKRFPMVTIVKGNTKDYTASLATVQPDIVLLGYDQMLPPNVTAADFPVPVERLPAYMPEIFKSSLLKQEAKRKKPIHICVFCGSRMGSSPVYAQVALEAGTWIAAHRYTLVYGGSDAGLMGIVANEVMKHTGTVIGIQPAFFKNTEHANRNITKYIETKSMSTRKDKMIEIADVFLVFTGGIGTFDEVCEVLCLQSIGQLKKPIIIINTHDFFDPFLAMLQNNVDEGFMDESVIKNLIILKSIEELWSININTLLQSKDEKI